MRYRAPALLKAVPSLCARCALLSCDMLRAGDGRRTAGAKEGSHVSHQGVCSDDGIAPVEDQVLREARSAIRTPRGERLSRVLAGRRLPLERVSRPFAIRLHRGASRFHAGCRTGCRGVQTLTRRAEGEVAARSRIAALPPGQTRQRHRACEHGRPTRLHAHDRSGSAHRQAGTSACRQKTSAR